MKIGTAPTTCMLFGDVLMSLHGLIGRLVACYFLHCLLRTHALHCFCLRPQCCLFLPHAPYWILPSYSCIRRWAAFVGSLCVGGLWLCSSFFYLVNYDSSCRKFCIPLCDGPGRVMALIHAALLMSVRIAFSFCYKFVLLIRYLRIFLPTAILHQIGCNSLPADLASTATMYHFHFQFISGGF